MSCCRSYACFGRPRLSSLGRDSHSHDMDEVAALALGGTLASCIGAVVLTTAGAVLSDALTDRAAKGFSHSNAMKAATRSQIIMAQKTFVQDPVFSNNQAAPGAANRVARPFAV
jgi:hypothetical protein